MDRVDIVPETPHEVGFVIEKTCDAIGGKPHRSLPFNAFVHWPGVPYANLNDPMGPKQCMDGTALRLTEKPYVELLRRVGSGKRYESVLICSCMGRVVE